jgi:hypothetical protein
VIYEVQTLSVSVSLSLCLSVRLWNPQLNEFGGKIYASSWEIGCFQALTRLPKKIGKWEKIPSSHACVFCKTIKLQFMNSSAKSRLPAMSPARGPVAKHVQKLKFLKSRDASWVLCKRIVVLELETM